MRIENNYKQRQPNFSSLKSIKYSNKFNPDIYPEEITKLLKTLKESKAFNEFFKQYDVDVYFNKRENFLGKNYVSMKLDTTVQKPEGNNYNPIFSVVAMDEKTVPTQNLINSLTKKIKNIEFSDLKNKLDDILKQIEIKEKFEKSRAESKAMHKREINDITNSLISHDSPEAPKKKTFIEKLFGWLK